MRFSNGKRHRKTRQSCAFFQHVSGMFGTECGQYPVQNCNSSQLLQIDQLQIYTGFHRHYPVQNATPAFWFAIYPVGAATRVQVTQGFIVLFCPAVSEFCNLMEWQHKFFPVLPHLPAYLWLLLWLRCLVLY